jgi:chemotaxis response regulator CheB
MPHAAIEMNVIDKVLPLEKIAEEIVLMVSEAMS